MKINWNDRSNCSIIIDKSFDNAEAKWNDLNLGNLITFHVNENTSIDVGLNFINYNLRKSTRRGASDRQRLIQHQRKLRATLVARLKTNSREGGKMVTSTARYSLLMCNYKVYVANVFKKGSKSRHLLLTWMMKKITGCFQRRFNLITISISSLINYL